MRGLDSIYRTEGDHVLIELEIKSLFHLFNTLDPSPFYEKDLDADTEEYIVDAMHEIDPRKPVKIVIYLPPEAAGREDPRPIEEAIHHYFAYKRKAVRQDLRQLFQHGRWSLMIGLLFLVSCMAGKALLSLVPIHTVAMEILSESLVIMGWVAMWRPIQIFLYDWWPIQRTIHIMDRLSHVAVSIHPLDQAPAAPAASS